MKNTAVVTTLAAILLAACSRGDSKKTDSALARDLALASQMQPAQPQFQDTAFGGQQAPARIENAPRTRVVSRPPAAAQAGAAESPARTIAAGSVLALASQQRICTSSNRPGDRFVATLLGPVTGSNGAVIPSGSAVVLEVASVSPGTDNSDPSVRIRVHSVEFNGMSYQLDGDVATQAGLERTRILDDPNADKKKVLGGAVAGAIVGRMIGKSTKGTVIGAAAGAATGAVAAKAGQKFEACLPVGGMMQLTLAQSVVL